ncbi:hypothetical protein [Corynebacterium sp. HMSC055A01]|uniref:hypothetical protein n=1 Tax=Corynebacterium sp. HMSC055A01 TaxID=1715083 RepID=UPI00114CEC7E|nr:hypothetical protein [Corynebacterium sp. HMSC055A01]
MKKRFTVPAGALGFSVLVETLRPLESKDFVVCVSAGENLPDSDSGIATDLSWSPGLNTFFHYCGNRKTTGWVGLREFIWGNTAGGIVIEIKNRAAKDLADAISDFRLGVRLANQGLNRVTIVGEDV